jgi:peptidoglycan hydrolase CwlO-like protein
MPAFALRLLAPLALALLVVGPARGAGEQALQQAISGQRAREGSLSAAAARLGRLERLAQRQVDLLQSRLTAVQSDLTEAQGRLARTQTELAAGGRWAARLEARVRVAQGALANLLRARYESDQPDLVTVVLHADGFSRLLEQLSFVRRVQDRDANLLQEIRVARRAARAERAKLAALEPHQREAAAAVARRRDALAAIRGAADRRRATLTQARTTRLQLLADVRADRRRSERSLRGLRRRREQAALRALARLEQQRKAAVSSAGPGGPWAIPYAIVECESGGQNLPPNSATASGYYQFLDSTWRGLGGSTPKAYLAPKAEQDRLAARLWDGGRGASNWVCAGLVGLA